MPSGADDPGAARAWLFAEPPATPAVPAPRERAWWTRWPVWAAGALVVVGAGLTAGLLASRRGEARHERDLKLDPGELPR
jgi:hypothetical protein